MQSSSSVMASKQSLVLSMVVVSAFATPIMLSATNVALPTMSKYFSLDAVTVTWVPMAYLMASAMFVLIFGRCADLFGRKKSIYNRYRYRDLHFFFYSRFYKYFNVADRSLSSRRECRNALCHSDEYGDICLFARE
jgi:hypothetical protein